MIIITGASRGIGKYLFEKFWEGEEIVYGTYHTTQPNTDKIDFLTKVDISNHSDVRNWIDTIKNKMKEVILINCAGINYNSFAHKADINQWGNVINTNLIGTFNVIREVLPIMRESSYGRIINLSSIVAQTFVPGSSAYAASKAGLWGLVRSIAIENSRKGITINNLNLGYYNLGMISEVPKEYQDILKKKIPSGNFGEPKNILNAIKFLIENDYINGTSVDINGGLL
ncbi:MAG: SDR family oxidoreductase [Candidatus Marinimicrobia bacterium]|jgi:NAD(P)-dependent dehydrogenase (short-subunit alcohol dehydrogenase family)|nr:SDR family oxidoreductase [Candidatus Neomarinimicrobiota bacterium]MBT7899971.1 SDR family oxidoreductase [Candidatus Neomarinimicrobiota bacterium]